MNNNETIGMSAEAAACLVFCIFSTINPARINDYYVNKFLDPIIEGCEENNIILTEHVGGNNGKVDFKGELDDPWDPEPNIKLDVSMKSLKGKDGKIAPQGGQMTYNSFDTTFNCEKPDSSIGRVEANTRRWNWIKNNIALFLSTMQEKLFCCDVLLLLENCEKNPKLQVLKKKDIDYQSMKLEYNHPHYAENPHKRKPGEVSEFSTNVFTILNGEKKNIGEFQFHFKSRKNIKFRFYKKWFMN